MEADAGAIAHVHVESWRTTYVDILPDEYLESLDDTLRARLWREWLSSGAVVLAAEAEGKIVGFAHAGKIRERVEACDAELYSIYLLRGWQGKGIGTGLLRAVAAALIRGQFGSVAVWVLERNPSRMFYEKKGGRIAASRVIDIGGTKQMEVAYCWPDIKALVQ